MLVYLDTCALQRPLDDQNQLRIRVESEAILAVLSAAAAGEVDLVASDVLRFEIEKNPLVHRRDFARRALAAQPLKWLPRWRYVREPTTTSETGSSRWMLFILRRPS